MNNTIGAIVCLCGLVVLFGWYQNIEVLKRIHPDWVSMKVMTANSFILCGILLLCSRQKTYTQEVLAHALSISLFGFVLLQAISNFSEYSTGIENLLKTENPEKAIFSTAPGIPSIGTMAAFVFCGIYGLLPVNKPGYIQWKKHLGWGVIAISVVALGGYMFKNPLMYYYIENLSTAMAMHTAILFLLLGIGLYAVIEE